MDDAFYMREAIAVSRTVAGRTGDNPAIGCVVVRNGEMVSRGATQPPGGAHAEVVAVTTAEAAGHPLGACDVYITMEPCSFQGRTPPCSRMLVEKRPRRVVLGIRDPHPLVRGAGIEELRGAGIEVVEGVLLEEISALLAWWVQRNTRPA